MELAAATEDKETHSFEIDPSQVFLHFYWRLGTTKVIEGLMFHLSHTGWERQATVLAKCIELPHAGGVWFQKWHCKLVFSQGTANAYCFSVLFSSINDDHNTEKFRPKGWDKLQTTVPLVGECKNWGWPRSKECDRCTYASKKISQMKG